MATAFGPVRDRKDVGEHRDVHRDCDGDARQRVAASTVAALRYVAGLNDPGALRDWLSKRSASERGALKELMVPAA
jgi:hypothetical protein